MSVRLQDILEELGIPEFVQTASDAALGRSLAATSATGIKQHQPERLPRLAFVYETQGVAAYSAWVPTRADDRRGPVEEALLRAFVCWSALATLPEDDGTIPGNFVSRRGLQIVRDALPGDAAGPELILAFRQAVAGLGAGRTAETRLELRKFDLGGVADASDWSSYVSHQVLAAFVMLARKGDGWREVTEAISAVQRLREMQVRHEEKWLDSQDDAAEVTGASALVGLYHMAQMVTLTGGYLVDGSVPSVKSGGMSWLHGRLDLHGRRARAAFEAAADPVAVHTSALLWLGCRELVHNSIWTHVEGLGPRVASLARELASHADKPVIELWPAQQAALRQGLLDAYARAILIEMPTSAGKTLLAKFAMVQTHALTNGTIAYVVPTRALVNQVTVELRQDFAGLKLRVEQAVPAFELNPTEDRLLSHAPDVLVTTPEKLEFLVRRDHPATRGISMVIADEAHNLSDANRGPRLELLLGMIKRDRPGVRFLLLSPFLPESDELLSWLGGDRGIPAIRINWRPARRLVGALRGIGAGKKRRLSFETLPAADNADTAPGLLLPLTDARPSKKLISIKAIVQESVSALAERGGILVLCRGPGTCVTRAKELAQELPAQEDTPELAAVCNYLESEWGGKPALIECLRHGVAYHHAGLSAESRWLVESLIRRRQVKVVCGTTTLAQGVNFPISSVLVESLRKGDTELTYADFWNIAGRAGRTLVDTVGIVGFPTHSAKKKQEWTTFLQGEAEAISSQLATLIDRVDEIGSQFNVNTLYNVPKLSPLLQFLAHALRVAGSADFATQVDELEELLRASLVYHQLQRRRGSAAVEKLVSLCRSYLASVRTIGQGTLVLADQTGFATPSVLRLLSRKSREVDFRDPQVWEPANLFGESVDPLARRVDAIAHLPEMQLGAAERGPFSPERVAAILRDWVSGDSLEVMARRYAKVPKGEVFEADRDTVGFSRYLFSALLGRASWGIGALEGVCLAGSSDEVWRRVGYVPSMIYFGVKKPEAVWLRMVGVPRIVAEGLGQLWQLQGRAEPQSFDEIRGWVTALDDRAWRQTIPTKSKLSPAEMQWIWKEFAGE